MEEELVEVLFYSRLGPIDGPISKEAFCYFIPRTNTLLASVGKMWENERFSLTNGTLLAEAQQIYSGASIDGIIVRDKEILNHLGTDVIKLISSAQRYEVAELDFNQKLREFQNHHNNL